MRMPNVMHQMTRINAATPTPSAIKNCDNEAPTAAPQLLMFSGCCALTSTPFEATWFWSAIPEYRKKLMNDKSR